MLQIIHRTSPFQSAAFWLGLQLVLILVWPSSTVNAGHSLTSESATIRAMHNHIEWRKYQEAPSVPQGLTVDVHNANGFTPVVVHNGLRWWPMGNRDNAFLVSMVGFDAKGNLVKITRFMGDRYVKDIKEGPNGMLYIHSQSGIMSYHRSDLLHGGDLYPMEYEGSKSTFPTSLLRGKPSQQSVQATPEKPAIEVPFACYLAVENKNSSKNVGRERWFITHPGHNNLMDFYEFNDFGNNTDIQTISYVRRSNKYFKLHYNREWHSTREDVMVLKGNKPWAILDGVSYRVYKMPIRQPITRKKKLRWSSCGTGCQQPNYDNQRTFTMDECRKARQEVSKKYH